MGVACNFEALADTPEECVALFVRHCQEVHHTTPPAGLRERVRRLAHEGKYSLREG